jgi:hypothetical protein
MADLNRLDRAKSVIGLGSFFRIDGFVRAMRKCD